MHPVSLYWQSCNKKLSYCKQIAARYAPAIRREHLRDLEMTSCRSSTATSKLLS